MYFRFKSSVPLRQKNWSLLFLCTKMLLHLRSSIYAWTMSCVELTTEFWTFVFFLIFQLEKNMTELSILGHLQAILVPQLKRDESSKLNKTICTSFRSDFFSSAERFKIRQQFQYSTPISTLQIWHDPCIHKGTFFASQNR